MKARNTKTRKSEEGAPTRRPLSGGVRLRDTGRVVAPEAVEPRNIKVAISIKLDADVLEFFKERAKRLGADPYQTQINKALREAMGRDQKGGIREELLADERFIAAVAELVAARE